MTVVVTRAGRVRGTFADGVHTFRGIPYAQPPVGLLRFAAPMPHEPWDGVLDAHEFGPPPPQPMRVTSSDEWLTVNVWTPDPAASGLPVMVWLYGGRFTTGASDESDCDGTRLAAAGVVVVSPNYRLAGEGFMAIDGAVPNRGLLDQVAALQWVRDNIAGFGGNPNNVTVFGESAGAASVVSLMVMPAAAGLFHRGIAESVPAFLFGSDLAADVADVVAEKLGRRATASDLEGVAPQDLADAVADIEYRDRWGYGLAVRRSQFGPVVDGETLPDSPFRAFAAGAARGPELLIGHNRDEYRYVVQENGGPNSVTAEQAETALNSLPPIPDGAQAYRAAHPRADHAELYELVCSDFVYRMPTLHMAQAHVAGGGTTYPLRILLRRLADRGGAHHRDPVGVRHAGLAHRLGAVWLGAAGRSGVARNEHSLASVRDRRRSWLARLHADQQLTRVFDAESAHHALSGAGVTTDLGEPPVRPLHVAPLAGLRL